MKDILATLDILDVKMNLFLYRKSIVENKFIESTYLKLYSNNKMYINCEIKVCINRNIIVLIKLYHFISLLRITLFLCLSTSNISYVLS